MTKLFILILLIGLAVNGEAQTEVGEITTRTAPAASEAALSVLQNARNTVQKRLGTLAAQADPLASDTAAYRSAPSAENAMRLLHRMATVAAIGAKESDAISSEADAAGRACAGLSAQCLNQAELLRPGLAKASRARTEYGNARAMGFSELRGVHESLVARGITNEVAISAAERRKISQLLRLCGAADLGERFLRMEANTTEAVIERLTRMSDQFAARQQSFQDLREAYALHAASFRTVGGSTANLAHLIDVNQRFDAEAHAAAELEGELTRFDNVLGKTFEAIPEDFSQVLSSGTGDEAGTSRPTGLWQRLLRFLGLGEKDQDQTAAGGSTQ